MTTREEIAEALAAREAATARMAQAARPPGGRWEGPATTLPQNVLSAPFRAAAGFTQAAIDRATEEQPLQAMQGPQATRLGGPSLTPRSLQASTDYEPRRVGAELGAETAMNVVGLPTLTGGVPAGAVGSAARDPKLWHDLSRVKLPKPVAEMQATHVPTQAIKEKTISPAQLEGGWLLPAVGDRTSIGSNLMGFNGFNFANPVAMQGGHGFMAAQADKGLAWASNPGVITRISNKVKKLGAEGDPVYFPYTAMHNEGGDFSHHVSDTLSEAVKLSKVTQKAEREFNRAMKADHIDFGAVKNWPGVRSEDLREYLIKAPGDVRNKFAKVMDTAKFQELGFPSVAEARHAVTDPRLLDAPRGSAGLSISKMDPTGKAIPGASGHRTYSTDIAGDYIGGLARQIPRDVFYPDIVKGYEKLGSDPNLFMALGRTGAPIAQKATPQWVDSVSKWMEQNPRAGMKYSNFTDRKTGAVMGSVAAMDEVRPSGIKAWHASPHDFDKFDLSKIGTGQGAASYGPGIYAAESPKVSGVGGEYWKEFAGHFTEPTGDPVMRKAVEYLQETGGDRAAALKMIGGAIERMGQSPHRPGHEAARDLLASDKQVGPRVYELNIKADPQSFLQWDKPLQKQIPAVQELVGKRGREEDTGARAYRLIADRFGGSQDAGEVAMARMREAGIPGIRYADAASRTPVAAKSFYDALATAKSRLVQAEQKGAPAWELEHLRQSVDQADARIRSEKAAFPRTYNYVLNNPDIIEIMRKLAVPGAVGAGTMGELVRQDR